MRRDEEEILIRDDSGLLYDDSVTVSSARPRRPTSWWQNMNKTLCLSLAFFVMGMCIAVPGPTLLDLAEKINTDIPHISTIFSARAVGYLVGAILGGALFNYFDKQLLMFCTLLVVSVATIVVPWCLTLVAMGTLVALQGLGLGILYTGGNIFCVKLWGRKNAPYLQTLHFTFAIGAFLAPVLARPFLSNENLFSNTTMLKNDSNTSLSKTRNIRSDIYDEKLYYILNDFEQIDGFLTKNDEDKFRYKRDSESLDTTSKPTIKASSKTPDTTKHVSSTQTTVPLITTLNTLSEHNQSNSDNGVISNGAKIAGTTKAPTATSGEVSNGANNGTNVTGAGSGTTKAPTATTTNPLATTTVKATKPKAASDRHLKEHTADAKQMSDLKQASEPVDQPAEKPVENVEKSTTKTSLKVTETPKINGTQSSPVLNNNRTGNQSGQTGSPTTQPSRTTGLVDENRDLKNESDATGAGVSPSATSAKTSEKPPTVKVAETTKKATTTASSTTSTTASTTTTTTTTTTQKPETTTTEKATTAKITTTAKPKPQATTSAKKTSIQTSTQKATSAERPSSTKSPIVVTKGSKKVSTITQSSTTEVTTGVPKKPTTAEDIFNNVIGLVKTISKIQFVYAIIGSVAFLSAVIFLICYCRNKKRLSFTKGDNFDEGVKGNSGCFKATVLFMLFIFFICYVGLEVAFSGLVTFFSVGFNHWPKEQGAVVTAIFWGAVAVGRGFSIFISRCCRPTAMLSADLCLMVFAGLVLSIGTYFVTELLWLGTLILGLGMSSVLPGIISWTETYFSTTGITTVIIVMGSTLGEMFLPIMTSYLFTFQDEMVLMRLTLALSAILLVLFIIMSCYGSRNGETYTVRDRNGFLPLQVEENDDDDENVEMNLLDIDTPQKRRKHRRKEQEETEVLIPLSDLEED